MKLNELIDKLSKLNNDKTDEQKINLNTIAKIAKEFHNYSESLTSNVDEKIKLLEQNENITIIEIAHQSNFMPYYGVWKKAVFAGYLSRKLNETGIRSVALFGFVDNDMTVNNYLYRNKIPYNIEEGYKNIGFNIKGKNEQKKRLWCKQPLPEIEKIIKQIEFLTATYTNSGLSQNDDDIILMDKIFRKCYDSNSTYSQANAKFFSYICNRLLDLNVVFFNYSEAQESNIFTRQFEYLFSKRKEYIDLNNTLIKENGIDLEIMPEDHVPFWYHCECGCKIRLKFNDDKRVLSGNCPICNNYIEKPTGTNYDLSEIYKSISFEAISRELIAPTALGTDVYIEGYGGSLSFRKISDVIGDKLNFRKTLSLRWKSKDKYLSTIIKKAIHDFQEKYPINSLENEFIIAKTKTETLTNELRNLDIQNKILEANLRKLDHTSKDFKFILQLLRDSNIKKKNINTELVNVSSMLKQIEGFINSYNITPSIFDEILSVGINNISKYWNYDLQYNDIDIDHKIILPEKKSNLNINYESNEKFFKLLEKICI